MNRSGIVLLLSALAVVGCETPDTREDERAIRLVVQEFSAALTQNRFDIAAGLIDSTTLEMYDVALSYARNANYEELQALGLSQKLLVLNLRHRHSFSELEAMSAVDVFAFVFKNLEASGISVPPPGEVIVDGSSAYGTMHVETDEPGLYFIREDGDWRIQFSRLDELLERNLGQARDQLEISDVDLVFRLIAGSSHHPPNIGILQGPLDYRMPTIERDGWATDYPGPPIALDEPERFSRDSPMPRDLVVGQEVEVLFRAIGQDETNPYWARREALWVVVSDARPEIYTGKIIQSSSIRQDLHEGTEVKFFAGSVITVRNAKSGSHGPTA